MNRVWEFLGRFAAFLLAVVALAFIARIACEIFGWEAHRLYWLAGYASACIGVWLRLLACPQPRERDQ